MNAASSAGASARAALNSDVIETLPRSRPTQVVTEPDRRIRDFGREFRVSAGAAKVRQRVRSRALPAPREFHLDDHLDVRADNGGVAHRSEFGAVERAVS